MHVVAPNEVSTCRSKWSKNLQQCISLRRRISQMEVEDFESRPRKTGSFAVEREKKTQEWTERKLPKVLPGYCGGRLPGRSTKEAGGEEEEEKEEKKQRNAGMTLLKKWWRASKRRQEEAVLQQQAPRLLLRRRWSYHMFQA